ncbi:MAG: TolC family protein [Bacteroidota bacterium]
MPIIDWGRSNARYRTAKASEKLVDYNNDLDESTLVQEIITIVQNFELLKHNILLTKKTDSVAQRRYDIANNLYQAGKLSVTDINLAQTEKDNARRNYVTSLRNFWNAYYLIRRLTLFDFEKNLPLMNVQKSGG